MGQIRTGKPLHDAQAVPTSESTAGYCEPLQRYIANVVESFLQGQGLESPITLKSDETQEIARQVHAAIEEAGQDSGETAQ